MILPPPPNGPWVPITSVLPLTAGVLRALSPGTPVAAAMLALHTCWPVARSTAKRLPAQSGKYTRSASRAGVADTSPPVVNSHFLVRVATFVTEILRSDSWARVFCRSPPAESHLVDGAAAATVTTSKPATAATSPTDHFRIRVTSHPLRSPAPRAMGCAEQRGRIQPHRPLEVGSRTVTTVREQGTVARRKTDT